MGKKIKKINIEYSEHTSKYAATIVTTDKQQSETIVLTKKFETFDEANDWISSQVVDISSNK